jgi:hypothetical protein
MQRARRWRSLTTARRSQRKAADLQLDDEIAAPRFSSSVVDSMHVGGVLGLAAACQFPVAG